MSSLSEAATHRTTLGMLADRYGYELAEVLPCGHRHVAGQRHRFGDRRVVVHAGQRIDAASGGRLTERRLCGDAPEVDEIERPNPTSLWCTPTRPHAR